MLNILRTVKTPHGVIRTIRYNDACEYAITTGNDRSIKLWNPLTGALLKSYSGHSQDVLDAVSSTDNSEILSAGGDKAVYLYDVITGVIKRRFLEHLSKVNCVRFNSDSSLMLSASDDNTIKLWDARSKSNAAVQTLSDASDAVTCIDTSDYEILSSSLDKSSRIYDIRFGQLISDFIGDELTFCRFGGENQLILLAALNSTIKLFDRMSGGLFNEYADCSSAKYKLECAFAVDDKLVVSGSENGGLCVWNLIDCMLIYGGKIKQETAAVTSVVSHSKEPWILASQGNFYHLIDLSEIMKSSKK